MKSPLLLALKRDALLSVSLHRTAMPNPTMKYTLPKIKKR